MKKTMILLVCAVLGGTAMQSCKKDKKNPTTSTQTASENEFTLTSDGEDIDPSTISVQESGGVITCVGIVDTSTTYSFSMDEMLAAGTYPIDGTTQFDVYHSDDSNATTYTSTSGSVTIITNDTVNNVVSGTFECTLTRLIPLATKNVTNGAFSIKYVQ